MTTKYYKLPGSNEFYTWDYLHNTLGYTTVPTEEVGYKSTLNWGTSAGTGYCSTTSGEWFVQGQIGWYSLSQLAWDCDAYPGSATDLKVEKSGTESNAASLILDGTTEYWLIESELDDGWCTRAFWEGEGWAIVEDHAYDFILVDSTTGRITYGVENLTEIEFTPTGYFTIDDGNEVIFVEQSPFPVVCIDEGTRTPESIAPDASFDTELPYYASKLYIVTTDDGQDETLYGWEAEEGTPAVALEILLALRYDPSTSQWKTVAFDQTPSATENYWWGCVINQEDAAALQAFGLTYHDPSSIWSGQKYTGPIGNVVYDSGYSYEVLALYSDMGTTEVAQSLLPSLTLKPLNRDNTDLLTIWSKDVIDTAPVKTWKVRITKL